MSLEKELQGRVALVTGAAGAIGRAISNGFLAAGACVTLVDIDQARLEEFAQELSAQYEEKNILSVVADVKDSSRVKQAFEGPDRRPVVGWLGRLMPEKGPLEFLKVAARIEEERRTAEFLLAGEGPLKDAVRTMADDLGLRQKITFVFEGVEAEAVLPVMDVFVSTSRSEGLGLSVIEAMACGKPVVATAQGGQFDVVRDGHSGYLYQPGDIDACAARTLSLISNPEAAREMGVNGREIVEEQFDARNVAVKLMEVYEQILNEST